MITRPGSHKPASRSMSYAEYPTNNPHSSELVGLIQEDLRRNGFALLKDMPFDTQDIEKTKAQFLSFCQQLGEPIPHNHSADSLVWSIRSMPYSESKFVTHSERNSEAELHTDSAFSENPEDFFCLFVVTKAECGGGESLLLSASNLLKEIRKSPDGERFEHLLRTKNYPFLIPTVFRKNLEAEIEFNAGPILVGNTIRYRSDVIERCLEVDPSLFDDGMIEALEFMRSAVNSSESTLSGTLETRDLVILHNKTMLHGRSAFTDENRHLLRVRMRERA